MFFEKGSQRGYFYGFSNQEKDNELSGTEGTAYAFEYRIHYTRLGRFLSVDPLAPEYPWNSTYAFAENRVIDGIDLEGKEYHSAQPDSKTAARVDKNPQPVPTTYTTAKENTVVPHKIINGELNLKKIDAIANEPIGAKLFDLPTSEIKLSASLVFKPLGNDKKSTGLALEIEEALNSGTTKMTFSSFLWANFGVNIGTGDPSITFSNFKITKDDNGGGEAGFMLKNIGGDTKQAAYDVRGKATFLGVKNDVYFSQKFIFTRESVTIGLYNLSIYTVTSDLYTSIGIFPGTIVYQAQQKSLVVWMGANIEFKNEI